MQARRRSDLGGDDLPPLQFDWCRMCSKIAFDAVAAAARQRAARRNAGAAPSPGRQLRPVDDRTSVMARDLPATSVPSRGALLGWLPRREPDDETAILPPRHKPGD